MNELTDTAMPATQEHGAEAAAPAGTADHHDAAGSRNRARLAIAALTVAAGAALLTLDSTAASARTTCTQLECSGNHNELAALDGDGVPVARAIAALAAAAALALPMGDSMIAPHGVEDRMAAARIRDDLPKDEEHNHNEHAVRDRC
jgi:hypothetical protein